MNTRAEWKQYDSFAPSRLRLSRVLYACRVEYGVRPCGAGRRVALSAAPEQFIWTNSDSTGRGVNLSLPACLPPYFSALECIQIENNTQVFGPKMLF